MEVMAIKEDQEGQYQKIGIKNPPMTTEVEKFDPDSIDWLESIEILYFSVHK